MDAAKQPPAQQQDFHVQIEARGHPGEASRRNPYMIEGHPAEVENITMMLPMPPLPYFAHGHQHRSAHQAAQGPFKIGFIGGISEKEAMPLEECTTIDKVQATIPLPSQQAMTPVGYPAQPLSYPPQFYQGPAQYIERQNIPPSPFIDQTNFALPQPGAHLQQINQKMSLELAPPAKGTMRVQQKIIDKDKLPQGEDTFQLTPFFQEKKVRQLFVRKVLILVLLQLLLTIGVSIAALYVEPIKAYVQENLWIMWTSLFITIATMVLGAWKYTLLYHHPHNLFFLLALTTFMSTLVASLVVHFDSQAVVLAFVVSAVLVLLLTLLGFLGKFDITHLGGFLSASLVVVLIASLMSVYWGCPILQTVVATISAMVFGVYLVLDVQKLMGNKKKSIGPDDYVFGAINIYLDVINLFLHILSIITCVGGQMIQ